MKTGPTSAGMTVSACWEHFDHGSDIGIRGYGSTAAVAFEQAGLALTAVTADLGGIAERRRIDITVRADNLEDLFLDWLNALIYEMASGRLLFHRYRVDLNDHELRGSAWGETVDTARHHPAVEIKGATYTELKVRQRQDGAWVAQAVVDV